MKNISYIQLEFSCLSFPRHPWEVSDFLFFCNLTLDDGGLQLAPPFPSLLNKPYFSNFSVQATCSSLHHDPHRGHSTGVASHAPGSPELCTGTPDVSETLEKRTGTFPDPLATPWLRQPRVCLAFPRARAGSAQLVATGTLWVLLCRAAVLPPQRLQLALPLMHNPEFAPPELAEVPLSALVFLSFVRNEV